MLDSSITLNNWFFCNSVTSELLLLLEMCGVVVEEHSVFGWVVSVGPNIRLLWQHWHWYYTFLERQTQLFCMRYGRIISCFFLSRSLFCLFSIRSVGWDSNRKVCFENLFIEWIRYNISNNKMVLKWWWKVLFVILKELLFILKFLFCSICQLPWIFNINQLNLMPMLLCIGNMCIFHIVYAIQWNKHAFPI